MEQCSLVMERLGSTVQGDNVTLSHSRTYQSPKATGAVVLDCLNARDDNIASYSLRISHMLFYKFFFLE